MGVGGEIFRFTRAGVDHLVSEQEVIFRFTGIGVDCLVSEQKVIFRSTGVGVDGLVWEQGAGGDVPHISRI